MTKSKSTSQHSSKSKSNTQIPDHVFESLARCALPLIQEYFKSEEGQREFAAWKAEKGKVKGKVADMER